jgi:hypothetical protein
MKDGDLLSFKTKLANAKGTNVELSKFGVDAGKLKIAEYCRVQHLKTYGNAIALTVYMSDAKLVGLEFRMVSATGIVTNLMIGKSKAATAAYFYTIKNQLAGFQAVQNENGDIVMLGMIEYKCATSNDPSLLSGLKPTAQ